MKRNGFGGDRQVAEVAKETHRKRGFSISVLSCLSEEVVTQQIPVMVADEFRRNVRNYLQLLCHGALETRAVEEFCQMPGGFGRIKDFLEGAGVSVGDVTNLLALSERTKAVFHRMRNHAIERYRRDEELRSRRARMSV